LVVGVALASAIFGVLREMTQTEAGFLLPNLYPGFGYAQFINRNHFAFLMEMALGLMLGLMVCGGLPRNRLPACFGVVLLLAGALVLSNSRGGIFSLISQLLLTGLLFSRGNPTHDTSTLRRGFISRLRRLGASLVVRGLLIVCFVGVTTFGIVWIGGAPLSGALEAIPKEVGAQRQGKHSAVRRVDMWSATWQMIKDRPVIGGGFGGYWMAITAYHDASGEMTPQEAHNDYLEFFASGGLIGVALGVWFLFVFIRTVRERLRTSDRFVRAARFGALVGLAGIAIHSVVDFGLHIPINALFFMTLVVIATVDIPKHERTTARLRRP
jgi:O-antigen ligase